MLEYASGDLLNANVEALVNTVNTVGVMGAGIALQFKIAYPEMFRFYEQACRRKEVNVGSMLVFPTGKELPKYIINFPTKKHWKNPSEIEWIESGLANLVPTIQLLEIKSLAIPALGCSNGLLEWDDVRPLMKKAFEKIPNVRILMYPPQNFYRTK